MIKDKVIKMIANEIKHGLVSGIIYNNDCTDYVAWDLKLEEINVTKGTK